MNNDGITFHLSKVCPAFPLKVTSRSYDDAKKWGMSHFSGSNGAHKIEFFRRYYPLVHSLLLLLFNNYCTVRVVVGGNKILSRPRQHNNVK